MRIVKIIAAILITGAMFMLIAFFCIRSYKFNHNTPNVVIMTGGMGNQMFQYAFAKNLERKTGRKSVFYNYIQKREYSLGVFGINVEFDNYINLNSLEHVAEHADFVYDETLFNKKKPSFYNGYFQNEKYFKDIKWLIKRAFRFPKLAKDDTFNRNLLNKIKKAKNPVFIHIRRGDYIKLGWQLPADYYRDAVKYILEHVDEPTFFVFGIDSSDFIKNELKLNVPYYVVGAKNNRDKQDWKDMYLMSECKHGIIANSTFSWWAAWLGPHQRGGIVVSPTPFVLGHDENIPENWVKIKRKVLIRSKKK